MGFVGKVMSLLFNMLSRVVIAFMLAVEKLKPSKRQTSENEEGRYWEVETIWETLLLFLCAFRLVSAPL